MTGPRRGQFRVLTLYNRWANRRLFLPDQELAVARGFR